MNKENIHALSVVVWGIYGILVGSLGIIFNFSNDLLWVSIITAVVGNSAHLVAFALSKSGITVSSQAQKVS